MHGDFAVSATDLKGRGRLSFETLREFLSNFSLESFGLGQNERCGLLLPNGPELALCILMCLNRYCCVPINNQQTVSEIQSELQGTRCKFLIVHQDESDARVQEIVSTTDIKVLKLLPDPSTVGLFTIVSLDDDQTDERSRSDEPRARSAARYNTPEQVVLVLHTSGTSGKKKMVPYSLETLCIGAACIIRSWGLTPTDVCLNMMPLFHVGGITRNVLAVILSGGGVICAPAFDAVAFWNCMEEQKVTWYYAGPTMHTMILEEKKSRNLSDSACKLRMVANAAGGLLASLAQDMKDNLGCVVLPSYGMTECMPISSPSCEYNLDHPSSSGQIAGPSVRILDDEGKTLPVGHVGNVCLKGAPLMLGYENDDAANASSFFPGGWFNTGDMGYLDEEGWIYLTGRSKEVINRGGEIISPFEVEEAVVKHERVKEVIAFSAPHDVLQEVVGVAIVSVPGVPRVDLAGLQRFVASTLHPAKWPQVVVFMDELPKGQANKVQRIRLSNRLDMKPIDDRTSQNFRMFEAACPPRGSGLDIKIPMRQIDIDLQQVMSMIEHSLIMSIPKPDGSDPVVLYVTPENVDVHKLMKGLQKHLHDYLLPKQIIALDKIPEDYNQLKKPDLLDGGDDYSPPSNDTEREIQSIWEKLLGKKCSINADFFESGGSSLLAGRMVAQIRRVMDVPLTAASIFSNRTISSLSSSVNSLRTQLGKGEFQASCVDEATKEQERLRAFSQTSFFALTVQALPLSLIYPLRRVSTWILFVALWVSLQQAGINRLAGLILALAIGRVVSGVFFPLFAVICKWIIIGRYKPGRYPLWGQYYLRWWLVDQIHLLCGRGVFRYNSATLCFYYRMLGAKIGRKVAIDHRAKLAEFDLIEIGSNSCIDNISVRSFCLDKGCMVLAPVHIGEEVCIASKVAVVPGIAIPSKTCLGPNSSSYDITPASIGSVQDKICCRVTFAKPNFLWRVYGRLILWMVWIFEQLPVLLVLRLMVLYSWYVAELDTYCDVLLWFLTPERIGYYLAIRVVRTTVLPFFRLFAVILVKKAVIGKFTPGKRNATQFETFRHWLMGELFPGERLQEIGHLIGVHYGGISRILRVLGAKVGDRIYWPGSLFEGLVEYDLLEVGDDVVFGSRSIIMTADAEDCAPIRIEAGANVGDRCVLLPGCVIGRNVVFGSGGLAMKNTEYEAGSKWVGCRFGKPMLLEAGGEAAATASTLRPFGNAFHLKNASYVVYPGWVHALNGCFWRCFAAMYRSLPIIAGFELTAEFLGRSTLVVVDYSLWDIGLRMVPTFIVMQNLSTVLSLSLATLMKWFYIGRRRVGVYNWDTSSYCQRWQLYLSATVIIRQAYFGNGILEYLHGTAFLVWFFRAHGSHIGRNVCLYPTGADPMMTEPELVAIGDGASVDSASLIAHINSRGHFTLNQVVVGPGATLRSNSRLLSGAAMMPYSTLLEHTLIMGGDVVDEGKTMQGWPGEQVDNNFWSMKAMGIWSSAPKFLYGSKHHRTQNPFAPVRKLHSVV
ncbi:hypothetical protein GUITHDRAFT_84689 [Guillardia theta CCMP2712]|uniref:Carrier domain-containing protein n=1 Tax=Guillardia theta (strain CCMP2712) TaxID=905079 RepID=L1JXB9_GUITC|nr:hypothetical protein GUITHDRAFT_84689 [Guillardia theta CCMP2712]EKX52743.1 hypothetical protein GUITHDRAFT_84689 [Guillardia theta CCMP2712]|eukprot:XP_005839723.1 hypothetical protein GUITHDRAFT_84689 [Guillardia theta CCMP2712]